MFLPSKITTSFSDFLIISKSRLRKTIYSSMATGSYALTVAIEMVANLRDETQFLIVVPRFDVRPGTVGDVGDLVHEADLGGKRGVGRVFGQLRWADLSRPTAMNW